MIQLIFKSLHLISMVAWFAGLFYIVRLFVYHTEAFEKPAEESRILCAQYAIMESRLFRIIMRPAMLLTWIFGIALIYCLGTGYTDYCGKMIKRLAKGEQVMTAYQFRLYNEVPTLFLVAIVLLAVYKNLVNFGYTFIGIVLLAILLVLVTRLYRKIRLRN